MIPKTPERNKTQTNTTVPSNTTRNVMSRTNTAYVIAEHSAVAVNKAASALNISGDLYLVSLRCSRGRSAVKQRSYCVVCKCEASAQSGCRDPVEECVHNSVLNRANYQHRQESHEQRCKHHSGGQSNDEEDEVQDFGGGHGDS